MAHAGQELRFHPAALLRRQQFRLQLLLRNNPSGDVVQQPVHDIDKNASAEKNAGHHQIRLSKQPHNQITQKEQDKQDNGKIKDPVLFVRHLAPSDFAAESDESVDIVDHQCASEINRNVYDPVLHAQAPFPSIDPGILFP